MTQKELFVLALRARGAVLVKKNFKHDVYSRPGPAPLLAATKEPVTIYYYLGRSGSLRWGRTLASSRPVSDKFKAQLIAEAYAIHPVT